MLWKREGNSPVLLYQATNLNTPLATWIERVAEWVNVNNMLAECFRLYHEGLSALHAIAVLIQHDQFIAASGRDGGLGSGIGNGPNPAGERTLSTQAGQRLRVDNLLIQLWLKSKSPTSPNCSSDTNWNPLFCAKSWKK